MVDLALGIPRVLGVSERMASLAGQRKNGYIWGLKGRQGRAREGVLGEVALT